MSGEAVVVTERHGATGVVVLNRPEVLNAISLEVMDRFSAALDGFAADPAVRVIVITGRGRAFSSGADIGSLAGRTSEEQDAFIRRAHDMMNRVEATPKPVIAAVNGVAAGGGFEMMLACDLAIAVETARMGLTEIRYGFLPGGGGTQRLPRAVPLAVAKRLLWTGELLTAEQAHELGLVQKVVEDGDLMTEVLAFAGTLAERSPAAVAAAKALANAARERPLAEGLTAEREANVRLLAGPDARAGIDGFLERRSGR